MKRSRHIQIYLKPGIREDDLMLRIWESCKRYDRPQDVFRAMLRNGMRSMVQSGEMPYAVVEECNLDAFVEKWRARQPAKPAGQAASVATQVVERHVVAAHPHYAPERPAPAVQEAPQPSQRPAEPTYQPQAPARPATPEPIPEARPAIVPATPAEPKSGSKRIGDLM
jgi:hypothetical protein